MIKQIKACSLAICLLILTLTTSSCVGGDSKIGIAGDPYIQANKMSSLGAVNATSNDGVPDLNAYSFHRENCYGGDSTNNSKDCVFKDTTGNQIFVNTDEITTKPQSGKGSSYPIHAMQVTKVGAQVFVLSSDKKLMICSLGGDCKNAEGAYLDMLAIDCTEQISGATVTCKTDKANYRSVLLLTDPTISKAQTPSAYKLSSQLMQLFINNASDVGVNVWNSDSDKGYVIKRADIKNDVPLAEIVESSVSRADLINYSFGTVEDKFFNLQLIYGRHQNKGTAYQSYYAGFQYGANLIKPDVSTNTLPIRTRDHITVFTPVAQEPLFEGGEVYKKMLVDLRHVAGGNDDSGDNYQWCVGLNVYCLIGARYGYANISDNYTSDIIDNAVFFGLMHVSGAAFGELAGLSEKIPGERALVKFGRGLVNFAVPLIGNTSTMVLLQMYGMKLHNVFFDGTTLNTNRNLPILTPALATIFNFPLKYAAGSTGVAHEWVTSSCEEMFITKLTDREITLRKNPADIIASSKSAYDLFIDTEQCSSLSKYDDGYAATIPSETKSLMKSIQVDSLNHFKGSTVSLVYQKLFIESDNNNKKTIDLQPDDLSDFVAESDPEQPAADISLRIPNCAGGSCDATYFADSQGNWLKDKNGKYITAINGNFANVYYMRTDSDFRPPLIWNLVPGAVPSNQTYSISAYQLSDLTCDEFNTKITRITGGTGVVSRAALHNRDAWSIILDKKGNTCNFTDTDYNNMVHEYEPSRVGDIFMALPLSIEPAETLIMYTINFGIGILDEIMRIKGIDPYNYSIRNAHANSQYPAEFNCTDLNIRLNGNENLQQISASHLPQGGMWIMGDEGLRYIDDKDNQKYTFTFNQFGNGVASSYNGKLLTSAHGDLAGMAYIDRYDEAKILEYAQNNLSESVSFGVNIDKLFQEGNYPDAYNEDFTGKLYTNRDNHLFVSYTYGLEDNTVYSWDINNWEKQGWISRKGAGSINNFAVTSDGTLNWLPEHGGGLDGIKFTNGDSRAIRLIDGELDSAYYNPTVFSIQNHVFVLTDKGRLFASDVNRSKFTEISQSGINLYEPITDAVGLDDGRFYLLSSKKVYSCRMPEKYLNIAKPLILNIINKTDSLRSVSLSSMNINNKYTITPGYKASNGQHEIDFKPQESQVIKIQKNNDRDEGFVFKDDLDFTGQYQLDGLSISATGTPNGDFKVEMNSRFAPKIFKFTTEKVTDNEYNIIVEKNGDDVPPPRDYHYATQGEIAEIQIDNNNKKVLQSVQENFNYKKYTNTHYSDNSKKIIVDGKLYWLGVSACNLKLNQLLMIYYDIGSNTNKHILQDIDFIKSVDGSIVDVKTFCENK